MKYRKQLLTILPMALLLGMTALAEAQSAQEIVVATDKVRNPDKPFRSTLRLTEYVGGQERDHDSLILYSKEDGATRQFRNLVQYVEPARDTGKRVLLDGHSLWFYDPNSKVSVRISAQQRLIGQAAIGDILTVNLAADYTPSIVGRRRSTMPRTSRAPAGISSSRPTTTSRPTTASNTGSSRGAFTRSRASSTPTAAGC